MARLRSHATEVGYLFLLSKYRLATLASQRSTSMDDVAGDLHKLADPLAVLGSSLDGGVGGEGGGNASLFVHHDATRVKLHPYEFIYCPFNEAPWWDTGGFGGALKLFHTSGGLDHPFTSRHRISIIHDILADPQRVSLPRRATCWRRLPCSWCLRVD